MMPNRHPALCSVVVEPLCADRRENLRPAQKLIGYASFPKDHWPKIQSANGIERRTEVVGIFLDEKAINRLVGALLLEQNDKWAVQRGCYMTLETIATLSDDPIVKLTAVAA